MKKNYTLIKNLIIYSGIIDVKPIIALTMLATNNTYQEIADALGFKSRQAAQQYVKKLLKAVADAESEASIVEMHGANIL